ncbi:MAG: FAD-dependent oxidoreductase [Candidatus Fermentibacter sp.]|nr:FAD-dependent oxidoreductase [Candidatus Fermentibacter sp.]
MAIAERKIVVGAGVAGLTLAERLCAGGGCEVTVLEGEESPGGLARTFTREGFRFDIGPHRFHTSDTAVQSYLLEILGSEITAIPRASSVYIAGRYQDWPLSLGGVTKLPFSMLLPSALDLFRVGTRGTPASFADHIIARYGRNLYRHFFRGYTRKFTGLDGSELHTDWAAAGVDRAVIDRKVKADSLLSLARSLVFPSPVTTSFIYPESGGIQRFPDLLAERIEASGGTIRLSTRVAGLLEDGGAVRGVRLSDGSEVEGSEVFWSAPVTEAFPGLELHFIDTIVYNVALRARTENAYQWCYFGEPGICFSRLSIPRNFSEAMVPRGADSLVAEVTCPPGDPLWDSPSSMIQRLMEDLGRVGAAAPEDILFISPEKVRRSYPVYTLDYKERLAAIRPPAGLRLLGRCGTFWYNNMDHSISQGLAMASGGDVPREFWKASVGTS